jgi:DNA-binding XRE family transcriptional regulator
MRPLTEAGAPGTDHARWTRASSARGSSVRRRPGLHRACIGRCIGKRHHASFPGGYLLGRPSKRSLRSRGVSGLADSPARWPALREREDRRRSGPRGRESGDDSTAPILMGGLGPVGAGPAGRRTIPPAAERAVRAALGHRLRALRRERGLTQRQLAERAGVSLEGVWTIEAGRKYPRIGTQRLLAKALDVSVAAFGGSCGGGPGSEAGGLPTGGHRRRGPHRTGTGHDVSRAVSADPSGRAGLKGAASQDSREVVR